MSYIKSSTGSGTAFIIAPDTTGALVFQTGVGPTTAATIDANGVLLIGSAAVGNTGDSLVVNGGTASYQRFQTSGTGTGSTDGSLIGVDGSGNTVINNLESANINFATANTVRYTINNSGAFGVGSSPSYGSSGQVLTSAGSGAAPTWGTVLNSLTASGSGLSVSSASGAVTISNTGVTSVTASTGLSASAGTGAITLTNTGVTSVAAGTNISVSASTGGVTITNTLDVMATIAAQATGNVGTWAWLSYGVASTATIVAGTNYGGAALRYWGYTGAAAAAATNTAAVATTPAGTWKAMGSVATTTSVLKATLYMRVA